MVRRLTEAIRPDISTSIASMIPAAAIDHNKANPNSEPAWAAVEIDPTSTKPPMLVTTPRTRLPIFFKAAPDGHGAHRGRGGPRHDPRGRSRRPSTRRPATRALRRRTG